MKQRRGYSLIELVMAMTIGFVLLGFGVRMLVLVLRLDRSETTRLQEEMSLDQLARQFRNDVASATPSPLPSKDDLGRGRLDLARASGIVVRYRVEKDALLRTESLGDESRGRNQYRLASRANPRIESEVQGGHVIVRIRWEPAKDQVGGSRRIGLPIEAVLGRYPHFASSRTTHDAKTP
jgi:type II secretory pathway component PulJ